MAQITDTVNEALQLTAEEIEKAIGLARERAAEAYQGGDDKSFETFDRQRRRLEEFRGGFESLLKQWREITKPPRRKRGGTPPRASVARGEMLEERAYVFPILRALQEAGGSAPVGEVLDSVRREVRHRLGPRDMQPVSGGAPRWGNRAQWVRWDMVQAGLLGSDSPRGTWEITDLGRAELQRGDLSATWDKLMHPKRGG